MSDSAKAAGEASEAPVAATDVKMSEEPTVNPSIAKIVALGYTINRAVQALSAVPDGDLDLAIAWLMENIGDPEDDEEEEGAEDEDEELKMVMVVRMDLKMGKGKIAAQCSHACLGAYIRASRERPEVVSKWYSNGAAKVVVQCKSGEELLDFEKRAFENKVNYYLVRDAGRTQIAPGSHTVLAVGPDRVSNVNSITGELKLL
jgi:PTH2 family peptidyl-tRNA hydrolase